MEKGTPVQILHFENGDLKLNEESLKIVLNHPDVKDLPVVAVSVAGKMRQGKSLLMSNFVRYLKHKGSADWLSDEHGRLVGFLSQGGSTGVTTGVYIWSELFVVELPTKKKVAVMLMDTQGSFDARNDLKESLVVFALSTMISSMQIYNINKFLGFDDLLNLQMFIEYGKLAQEYDRSGPPFQSLQILVRDWFGGDSEAAYGSEGGRQHIQKVMDEETKSNKSNEEVARDVKASFASIQCFLMPEPEKSVRHGTFEGTPSAMGDEFTVFLRQFVSLILDRHELVVKKQSGRDVKTSQLYHQFTSFATFINGKNCLSPQTMLQATAMTNYLTAIDEAMMLFKTRADEALGLDKPAVPDAALQSFCNSFEREAKDSFMKTPRIGGDVMFEQYQQMLQEKIDKSVSELESVNALVSNEERKRQAQLETHQREVKEIQGRHDSSALAVLERARAEDRETMRRNEIRHQESMDRQQRQFQDNYDSMSSKDRMRQTEVIEKMQKTFKEQSERHREDAKNRLKEIKKNAEKNMKMILEAHAEDREQMRRNETRHQEKMERMQKHFQENFESMSNAEKKQAQESLDKAMKQYQEQASREREEADRKLKLAQERAEENLNKMYKTREEDRAEMHKNETRYKENIENMKLNQQKQELIAAAERRKNQEELERQKKEAEENAKSEREETRRMLAEEERRAEAMLKAELEKQKKKMEAERCAMM